MNKLKTVLEIIQSLLLIGKYNPLNDENEQCDVIILTPDQIRERRKERHRREKRRC